MRRRFREQDGHVAKRRHGRRTVWVGRWREDGRERTKVLGPGSMSKSEAKTLVRAILAPINQSARARADQPAGAAVGALVTFGRYLEEVYLPVKRRKWKASTAGTTIQQITRHLLPQLADRPLMLIGRAELQALLDSKAAELSASVIDHLRFQLGAIFEMAASEGIVPFDPTPSLDTPSGCVPPKEKRVLGAAEFSRVLDALEVRERLIVRLSLHEGMRPGEVLALRIGDIAGQAVMVARRVYRGVLDVPKVRRSKREVCLSDGTASLMGEWIRMLVDVGPEDWLFPSEALNTPLSRDNVWRRNIQPRLDSIGLGWATFQVMRRSFASVSKELGVDVHTRAAQMGHNVNTNENEYAIASREAKLAAVRKVESGVLQ